MKKSAEFLREMKSVEQISSLTAYTTPVARCLEKAGIPVLLVGDSAGMVEMGLDNTRQVTLEHIEYHVAAVRRGAPDTHVIGDLPFNTDSDPDTALISAKRILAAGADSVKLEGPKYEIVRHLVDHGVAVVGHLGLTPQTATNFRQVGLEPNEADRVLSEAIGIAEAGAFLVVLEHMPEGLAEQITQSIDIPTISVGAGPGCDGQMLVINDVIGLGEKFPPFSRQYAHISDTITSAATQFAREVKEKRFQVGPAA